MTDRPDDAEEWDARYATHDGQMWSGRPNGTLVAELQGVAPGRALDVGCGEGADAVWLAGQGWQVTAVDISGVAIDRARNGAPEASVDWQCRDLLADPPAPSSFDLIVISYPALSHPAGAAGVRAMAAAVVSGGHLLVIGHDHDHHTDPAEHGFDPADYVSIDEMIEIITSSFEIVTDEVRDRPDPPADARHQTDRILRARRKD
jgi:SAM-dependent methyltransferase